MSAATTDKAARLLAEGRVTELTHARVYGVEGDSGTYLVTMLGGTTGTCTCPAGQKGQGCSHLKAANRHWFESLLQATPAPKPVCAFCKGEPVPSAASWADGKPRPPAQCPRCGERHEVAA